MKEEEAERISDELILMTKEQMDNIWDRLLFPYNFPELFEEIIDDLK